MPIISDKMKKAAKKAEMVAKKEKEMEEHKQREEEAKKELEEREAKEREEQERKDKKDAKKQKIRDRMDKDKKEKGELERRAVMRKEMAFIRKSMGPKPIKDEEALNRSNLQVLRTEIYSGAFGRVYKAKQGDNESLICKVVLLDKIPPHLKQNLLDVAVRVQRYTGGAAEEGGEASAGGGTKHPALVHMVDAFASEQKLYLFQEECDKHSIKDKIKKNETMDENAVKKTIKDVVECVKYLHSIGVSHNNLKPSHVIWDKQGQLKVVGLNQSSFYWDSDMESVVKKKRIHKRDFEKNAHLPPEAFLSEEYDPSLADVWALGVLMCQLLAKESPFKMKSKSDPPFADQWRTFAESKQFSDEAKQLLDRIFAEDLQTRPNIWQVSEDPYLKNVS